MAPRTPKLDPSDARIQLVEVARSYNAGTLGLPSPFFPQPDAAVVRLSSQGEGPHGTQVVDLSWPSEYVPYLPAAREQHLRSIENATAHARWWTSGRGRPTCNAICDDRRRHAAEHGCDDQPHRERGHERETAHGKAHQVDSLEVPRADSVCHGPSVALPHVARKPQPAAYALPTTRFKKPQKRPPRCFSSSARWAVAGVGLTVLMPSRVRISSGV